jgi:SAM-dependent methyltransferase
MAEPAHSELIRDQFTRQAGVFNAAATITNEQALKMIVAAGRPGPDDTVLDVACGGGIIVCAFAPHVTTLPFSDASFSIVVTRFSFHHFLDPLAVLKEMMRVCAPRGRIVVVDMYASEDPAKAAQWNRLEKLRDPSHVRCLSLSELKALFGKVGLPVPEVAFYDLRDSVKNLLGRSFPNPGDDVRVTEMFEASLKDDSLGLEVERKDSELRYAYPTAILSAVRP